MKGANHGRFSLSQEIGVVPGVKVNLSKTGVSTSVGGKGATLNVGHGKRMVTLGIPGTGLSYRTEASTQLIIAGVAVVIVVGHRLSDPARAGEGGAALVAAEAGSDLTSAEIRPTQLSTTVLSLSEARLKPASPFDKLRASLRL